MKQCKGPFYSTDEKMTLRELLTRWNGGKFRGAQVRFAHAVGSSEPTVSRWVAGDYPPDPEKRVRVAKELGVTVEELLAIIAASKSTMEPSLVRDSGGAEYAPSAAPPFQVGPSLLSVVEVPIVGRVAASGVDYAPDEPPRGKAPFPLYGSPRGRLEALQVAGNSQEPTAPDGSFIILKSRDFFRSGNLTVVRVDGEVLLKRVRVQGKTMILESDNKKFPPRRCAAKHVEILATVHQIIIVKEP